ncbi:MAG TPA: maleylpyruvate isomerase family mycothiol-dependent enzyme [Marmoricola sp.]|nr:maleylpyruvate isomerase family mycothiol-dependent enzyme [Marmoricola sp.]
MGLSTRRCLEGITAHSHGLADAARGNLDAAVEHCPGWTVADLVWHVTEVHWFWKTIAAGRLTEPPDESLRPGREPDERLVPTFLAGAADLVDVLRAADQSTHVWTWAPQQDIAFITRHQVQEAAVHHWDAAFAASQDLAIEPDLAADAIEEFLTFSLATAEEQAERGADPLGQDLVLVSTDGQGAWSIKDAEPEGPMTWVRGQEDGAATVSGTASDLLLWLYDRTELPVQADDDGLVDRFRRMLFTD